MNWYIGALKKYATFTGRARRKKYWMFVLINIPLLLAACGGKDDGSGPSFTPDFPLSYEKISYHAYEDGTFVTGTLVWEIRDAQDRLVPEVTVRLAATESTVTPDSTATGTDGRVTFVWRYQYAGRAQGSTSVLEYCYAYQKDCTPDQTAYSSTPNP
jgi:hypothetical protein